MKTYKKGDDFKDKHDTFKTYGITEIETDSKSISSSDHINKIEIFGDLKLRNKIIRLLNNDNPAYKGKRNGK